MLLLPFYIARMLKRPDMENQTRYGHVEKVRRPSGPNFRLLPARELYRRIAFGAGKHLTFERSSP